MGIAVGCVLGMLPLLFIDGKKGDREESPRCVTRFFVLRLIHVHAKNSSWSSTAAFKLSIRSKQGDLHHAGPRRHRPPPRRAVSVVYIDTHTLTRFHNNQSTRIPHQPHIHTDPKTHYFENHSVVVYAVERGEGREVKEAFASDGEPRAADTDAVRVRLVL